ncbi:MAG: phosphate ABC transporter permease PstA, partial [Vicinamibacteria bacterium]
MSLRKRLARGDHMIWLTGSALGICLLMIFGLLAIILVNGLGIFWPRGIEQVTTGDGSVLAGELAQRQAIPNPGHADHLLNHRIQLRTGNRDLYGVDFTWVDEDDIVKRDRPEGIFFVERSEYGPLIGTPVRIVDGEREIAFDPDAVRETLIGLVTQAARDREAIEGIEKDELGQVNYEMERLRLEARRLDFQKDREPELDLSSERAEIRRLEEGAHARYVELEAKLGLLLESAAGTRVTFETVDGREQDLASLDIYRAYPANELSAVERAGTYASRLWSFLTDEPREANTEGGIWPAIFGTVMMV